ncbi:MAG: hypothetical protein SF097_17445 [Acidobacteriota bacterium]|nr:hypothetical protein [Acidobacteriota bacterium]
MSASRTTLNEFFQLSEIPISEHQLNGIERQPKTQQILQVAATVSPLNSHDLSAEIAKAVSDTLKFNLLGVLVVTWSRALELRKYTDRTKFKPEDINYVELAKHTVKSNHKPKVQLLVNGHSVGEVEFDVALEFPVKGAILKVQDARIKQVRGVSFKGSCKIKYGEFELLKRESQEFHLPGEVDFGEGYLIPGAVRMETKPALQAA